MGFKIPRIFNRGWSIRLPSPDKTYQLILERLKKNEPFAFSRWGDGEWEAVLNLKNQNEVNCDGHQYFESLQESLRNTLIKNPAYMLGMQKLAYYKIMGRKIDAFLKKNKIKREWINADALHEASVHGQLNTFFEALKGKRILLVGPGYLSKIQIISFDLIEIPVVNAWLSKDEILKSINDRKDQFDVIMFCAGMTSNWFIDELFPTFNGFILDIGSLLDPYAGKETRTYHAKLKI